MDENNKKQRFCTQMMRGVHYVLDTSTDQIMDSFHGSAAALGFCLELNEREERKQLQVALRATR